MANGSTMGAVEKREDFLVTAIADLPEIDIQAVTGDTIAVVAGGKGGLLRITPASSNDDDVGAVSFGALNWYADQDLVFETRFLIGTITDYKFFCGLGDTIASADETSFSVTTATTTLDTMTDAIGFVFDNDETTPAIHCVSGTGDAVTVDYKLDTSYNLAAATLTTFRVYIPAGGQSATWSINGREVYTYHPPIGTSAKIISTTAGLVPGVWFYEQGTGTANDVDYLYARMGRT